MSEEFKLNYYFELYKDKPFLNSRDFRIKFTKKYGNFKYISELIIMINKYQCTKYGNGLCSTVEHLSREELRVRTSFDNINKRKKFGNRSERKRRLIEYDRERKINK